MSKYPMCGDCYFNNREPAICEQCSHGSEFEAAEASPAARGKPVKIHRRIKEADYED